jgi:hypothetical protein
LGHIVKKVGTKPNLNKVKTVTEFLIPWIVTNVRTFLGLIGYYKKYIRLYAKITVPLFELTKRDNVFQWPLECQKTFDNLKEALVFAPI